MKGRSSKKTPWAGIGVLVPLFFCLFLAGPARADVSVDSDEPLVQISYGAGEPIDLKVKAEAGAKVWVLLECPGIFPDVVFARVSDAMSQALGSYVAPFTVQGYPTPEAESAYYSEACPADKIDFGSNDITGLGTVKVTSLKGPDPANLEAIQQIILAPQTAGNHPPAASPLSLATDLTVPYIQQQLVATDEDGDVLTFQLMAPESGPGYAQAYVSPGSGMLYVTMEANAAGPVVLPYRVTDGQLFSDPANVTIEILEGSTEDKGLGNEDVDPSLYARFPGGTYSGDLLGAPGEPPTLPTSVDLSGNFPKPGAQGEQSSCVGWATAYALKSYQEKIETGWALNTSSHLFSPSFVYNQINGGQDKGSYINEALQLIVDTGAATLASMPYSESDYLTQPGPQALQEAANYKGRSWSTVDSTSQMKAALANRTPVVIGIPVYTNLYDLVGPDSVYNTISGENEGGHAVTVVGYDDNRYGGAFRIINSWSVNWGDQGYFWIPYAFGSQGIIQQAYVLEDTENSVTPVPEDPTEPEPAGDLPNLEVMDWSAQYDPRPRGEGTLQWRVGNTGAGTAPAGANVNLMLSANQDVSSGDIYVVYEDIPFDLAPGEVAYRDEANSIAFNFPDQLADGVYYMALWVDDLNEVAESNERDNVSYGQDQVAIENEKPDLAVQAWYAEWDEFGDGALTYEVINQGSSAAREGDWDINLVLTPDQAVGNGDEIFLFYESASYSLDPGVYVYRDEASAAYFNLYVDAFGNFVPEGTYYMALWVDDLNLVDESNELNNSSFGWNTVSIGYFLGGQPTMSARARGEEESPPVFSAYNGRILPPRGVDPRKVRISRTPRGGRSLQFLDEAPVATRARGRALPPPKTVSSGDHAIFPVVKEIPMP